jgi:hypothetical protein
MARSKTSISQLTPKAFHKTPLHFQNKISHLHIHIYRNPMNRLFLHMLLFLSATTLWAQSPSTRLKLTISPGDAIIRLDTTMVRGMGTYSLPAGPHRIQAWKSTYEYFDTTVSLVAGDTMRIRKLLHHSQGYIQYKTAMAKYKVRNIKPLALMWSALLIPVPLIAIEQKRINQETVATMTAASTEAAEAQALYSASVTPTGLDAAHNEFDAAVQKYDVAYRKRIRTNILLPLAMGALATAGTYLVIRGYVRAPKLSKPTFDETPMLSFDLLGGADGTLGICVHF